jgi:hypothetical protein
MCELGIKEMKVGVMPPGNRYDGCNGRIAGIRKEFFC